MASAKAKIRHVFGDTFSCRAAPPDILVKLSGSFSRHIEKLKCRTSCKRSNVPFALYNLFLKTKPRLM